MPLNSYRETESTFDAAPDFELPGLESLLKPGERVELSTVELTSTYFDTASMRLFAANLTLRRRTGQADTGWHLKVPGEGFRTELRWQLTDGESEVDGPPRMPEQLMKLISPILGAAVVIPVAQLRVTRTRHQVLDGSGRLRLEVADDQVRSEGLALALPKRRWREVEAELGEAGRKKDLADIDLLLRAAGAVGSHTPSKLGRALTGPRLPEQATKPTAGTVLASYLDSLIDAIIAGHFAVFTASQDPPERDESIHDMRVATRRLRATLRTFAALYDTGPATQLAAELRWLAAELGKVRDCQVLQAKLKTAVEELPGYLIIGDVQLRIQQTLSDELRRTMADLLKTFSGQRYSDLLAALLSWRHEPPLTERAALPATALSTELAATQLKLADIIRQVSDDQAPTTDLHRARRIAKRIRYAADALIPVFGKPARAMAHTASAVQTALGEYCDAVIAADALRQMADVAASFGEQTFTYGVLVGDQRHLAVNAARAVRTIQ